MIIEWVDEYERAWRAAGTGRLDALFSVEVRYVPSPWATAVQGLDDLRRFWEAKRDGPHEAFVMIHEIVAVEGSTAVVRVAVDDHDAHTTQWRDLWILKFGDDGRCAVFEEWPFAPDQADGHSGSRTEGSPLTRATGRAVSRTGASVASRHAIVPEADRAFGTIDQDVPIPAGTSDWPLQDFTSTVGACPDSSEPGLHGADRIPGALSPCGEAVEEE